MNMWEMTESSAHYCCELRSALKNKAYFLLLKKKKKTEAAGLAAKDWFTKRVQRHLPKDDSFKSKNYLYYCYYSTQRWQLMTRGSPFIRPLPLARRATCSPVVTGGWVAWGLGGGGQASLILLQSLENISAHAWGPSEYGHDRSSDTNLKIVKYYYGIKYLEYLLTKAFLFHFF